MRLILDKTTNDQLRDLRKSNKSLNTKKHGENLEEVYTVIQNFVTYYAIEGNEQ